MAARQDKTVACYTCAHGQLAQIKPPGARGKKRQFRKCNKKGAIFHMTYCCPDHEFGAAKEA